jgi:hypothetical protein
MFPKFLASKKSVYYTNYVAATERLSVPQLRWARMWQWKLKIGYGF